MICEMQRNEEGNFVCNVSQSVGYDVDRDEMIKALNYDRNQYQKGYEDGLKADRWIPTSVNFPEDDKDVLMCTKDGEILVAQRRWKEWSEDEMEWCAFETLGFGCIYSDNEVTAWMPLPESYKGNEVNDD